MDYPVIVGSSVNQKSKPEQSVDGFGGVGGLVSGLVGWLVGWLFGWWVWLVGSGHEVIGYI